MEKKNTIKLIKVLDNNKRNNILLMGATATIFEDAVIIPATIPSQKLGIGIDAHGEYVYPAWLKEIEEKKSNDRLLIIIDGLDKVSKDEQEKFYGILKYKGINGYSFPSQSQLICTSKSTDQNKISDRILRLNIIYNV